MSNRSRRARILTSRQAPCTGSHTPAHNHAATGMQPLLVSRDESRRVAISLRSPWNGRRHGSRSSHFFCIFYILTLLTAMLRNRLHPSHVGQCDGSSELPTSFSFTVRIYPALHCISTYPLPAFKSPQHRIAISRLSLAVWDAYLLTPTFITATSLLKLRQSPLCMHAF